MSHPNSMPEQKLLKDQFRKHVAMTCICTYPLNEAESCANDKAGFLLRGKSVHVMREGDELHLYRATKDMTLAKHKHRELVKI